MRKRWILLVLAIGLGLAAAAGVFIGANLGHDEIVAVPLAQFMSDPDRFESQLLSLQGYLMVTGGEARLYASEAEAANRLDGNAVRLDLPPGLAAPERGYVTVVGRGASDITGSGGMFAGPGRVPWLGAVRSVTPLSAGR
ncbi:MAG TPA: hypothetical protein VKS60_19535 [Stellaceae bacterium]|nr:hypothetical protein [Stellaceae bacterium]